MIPDGEQPGPWGPTVDGGRKRRVLARVLGVAVIAGLVAATAITTTGVLLVQQAEASLTRVPVVQLDDVPVEESRPRHFLLVGSDSREGLDAATRNQLTLGAFEGQRSDTLIYVSVSADREQVSLVSLPRDLMVYDENGRRRKLTDTFGGSPDNLIGMIQRNFGLPIQHYASISLGGFVDVVRTLGSVEICLDAPLRDSKAGANFSAGCHDMDPVEALAYVRSRSGARGDYERMERQQHFLRAVLSELTNAQLLTDPRQLLQLVDDLASAVTTDERLTLVEMGRLAEEMRHVVRGGLPMTTVPGYTQTIDRVSYVIAYEPGARAMFEDLRAGRPLADRGTREERRDTPVAIWSSGRSRASGIVNSTLGYAGFRPGPAGRGPDAAQADEVTRVFVVPGNQRQADWVAATLGVTAEPLPAGVEAPDNARVVVSVGEDADFAS